MPGRRRVSRGRVGRLVGSLEGHPSGTLEFPGLKPDTDYSFVVEARASGAAPTVVKTQMIHTLPVLSFEGPVSLQIQPLDVVVSWQSSASIQNGEMVLVYAGQEGLTTKKAALSENGRRATASLPVAELNKLLGGSTGVKEPPVIRVSMTDGTVEVTREVSFSFGVPRDTRSLTVEQRGKLSKDQKDAISSLVDDVTKRQKLDWRDLLRSGLPVILSLF